MNEHKDSYNDSMALHKYEMNKKHEFDLTETIILTQDKSTTN